MKNGIIKLLGALTLATTPLVSLVACGIDTAVAEQWMLRFEEVKVQIKENATEAEKEKAIKDQITKELKVLGIKPTITLNEDKTVATLVYTLGSKKDETKKVNITIESKTSDVDEAINNLQDSYDVADEKTGATAASLKTAAEDFIKTKLDKTADDATVVAEQPTAPVTGQVSSVKVNVVAKTEKGSATKEVIVKFTNVKTTE